MLRTIAATLLIVGSASAARAQPPAFHASANPVSDGLRDQLSHAVQNLGGSADLMPADKYAFHPTPAQMTFAKLMAHVAQTNFMICSGISGVAPPMGAEELGRLGGTESKDALAATVKRSFDFCTESLAKVTDAPLATELMILGRGTGQSRGAAMLILAADWADHYSTAAGYLRLNGILPPSARPK